MTEPSTPVSPSSPDHHRASARRRGPIDVAIVTVSDSRTAEDDPNGRFLSDGVREAGHRIVRYVVVADDPEAVADALDDAAAVGRVVVLNGGTGISRRDNTYDVVAPRLEKTLPGFGELFRMLSWEQVGAAAMLSRAVAGVYRGAVVFCVPGSPKAVRLAWERLIEPELEHVAWELGR